VEVVKPIATAALLVTVLGLICEIFVPGSGRPIDIGAGVFGAATWIVPLLLLARYLSRKKPRSSLASVGAFIGIFVVAASLSVMGISLGLLTLIFSREANWAWPAIGAICAFWLAGFMLFYFGGRGSRKEEATKGRIASRE
jgi:peptidoglycan biosynthesis protein MviN/MurJ (putative lipid II flippase)